MARSEAAPAWRRAFLRELARSGSVARAAEAAGIDRSSAYQARRGNAAFAASWERAVEAARAGLGAGDRRVAAGGPVPRPQPLPRGGGVTRVCPQRSARPPKLRADECVRASKAGRPCVVRAGPGRWSVAGERAFLEALTASANVRAAARAAGVSAQAAYVRRRQWPAFAAAWDAAKAEGYVRLEMALLHAATATLDPEPEVEAAVRDAPEVSVAEAMNLLRLHRASAAGGAAQRYGWRQREPDIEEVKAAILRRIEAIERAYAGSGSGGGE